MPFYPRLDATGRMVDPVQARWNPYVAPSNANPVTFRSTWSELTKRVRRRANVCVVVCKSGHHAIAATHVFPYRWTSAALRMGAPHSGPYTRAV
jgi:hypothetical protein